MGTGNAISNAVFFIFVSIMMSGCNVNNEDFKDDGGMKVVISLPATAQKDKRTLYPILDSRLDKYGFKNAENKWVITPKYNNTGVVRLKDGYYLVKKVEAGKRVYEFLDKYGENEIGQSFEEAREFASGIALVKKKGRTAVINRAGEVVDPVSEQDDPELNSQIQLDGRVLIASGKEDRDDEQGMIRVRDIWTGKTLYEGKMHYDRNVEGRYVVINDGANKTTYLYGYNGKVKPIKGYYVLRPGLDEIILGPYKRENPYDGDLYVYNLRKDEISPFSEWKTYGDKAVLEKILEFESGKKLYVYMVNGPSNMLMLYKEPIRKDIKENRFCSALGEFSEGVAPIQIVFRGSHYIYIDEDGEYVCGSTINGEFQQAYEFVDGYALVQLGARRESKYYNDKWCYVDKKGHIKIREDVGYIQNGQWFLE